MIPDLPTVGTRVAISPRMRAILIPIKGKTVETVVDYPPPATYQAARRKRSRSPIALPVLDIWFQLVGDSFAPTRATDTAVYQEVPTADIVCR